MDINKTVAELTAQLTENILGSIKVDIEQQLGTLLQAKLKDIDIPSVVSGSTAARVDAYLESSNDWVKDLNQNIVDNIVNRVTETANQKIEQDIQQTISTYAQTNINDIALQAYENVIKEKLRGIAVPARSIPVSSLNFSAGKISGDEISGGIINKFGSTGIEDQATECQITVLDQHTIFENTLVAQGLTVKGTTTLEGDLIIRGVIPVDSPVFERLVEHSKNKVVSEIDQTLFTGYSDLVFERIQTDGIDLSKITMNGKEVIRGNQLMPAVTESGLQKLGTLKNLEVSGEALLSESLYATKKRVGINTIDPSAALTIWDEEVELAIGKRNKDTVWINTPRSQRVILSSNGKENLVLDTDGSVQTNDFRLGTQSFSSAQQAPHYESTKGTVVFNANPSLGGPLGWVCLGGARWANFGIID